MFDSAMRPSTMQDLTLPMIWNQFVKFKLLIVSTTAVFFILSVIFVSLQNDVWASHLRIQEASDDQVTELIELNSRIFHVNPDFDQLGRETLLGEFTRYIEKQSPSNIKVRKQRQQSYEIQAKGDTPQQAFDLLNSALPPLHQQFLKEHLAAIFQNLEPVLEDLQQTTVERIFNKRKRNLKYLRSILVRMKFLELTQKLLGGVLPEKAHNADNLNIPIMFEKSDVQEKIAFFLSKEFDQFETRVVSESAEYLKMMKNKTIPAQIYSVSQVATISIDAFSPQRWVIVFLGCFVGFSVGCLAALVVIFERKKTIWKLRFKT
jgi:LPS O-antigen subunit length determinant protein (WzzB/FepE family)